MKVFLSWSGPTSRHVAETLRDWLPMVIQALEPWISVDIAKGEKWDLEITKALSESEYCILCLTQDNLSSTYIHYEAGAINAQPTSGKCTFLFNVNETDVTMPLASFQNTKFEKNDVYKLLLTLNNALPERQGKVQEAILKKLFDTHWKELKDNLEAAPTFKEGKKPRHINEMVEEILVSIRRLESATPVKLPPGTFKTESISSSDVAKIATTNDLIKMVVSSLEAQYPKSSLPPGFVYKVFKSKYPNNLISREIFDATVSQIRAGTL